MSKKLLFIFNQYSGRAQIRNYLVDIVDIMVKAGWEVTIYTTQAPRDATAKVISDAGMYDLVVCSGGDGTLDEVTCGMMRLDKRVPIGYIPAGSTNDFGASLGIDKDMQRAAEIAVTGQPFKCDVGSFGDDVFIYVAAFGIFTEVSYQTPQDMKNMLGHAAYILEGARQLSDIPTYSVQVEYDGATLYDDFIYGMITNSKQVGGFKGMIPGNIELNDGLFEVTLIRTPETVAELNEILAYLTLRTPTHLVLSFQAREVRFISTEEIPWTLDGEDGGKHSDITARNEQQAIEIMVESTE